MKIIRPLVLFLVCAVSLAGASGDSGVKRQFQGYYDRFVRAFMTSDWDLVKGLVAGDFQATGPAGNKLGWADLVKEFKQQRAGMSDIKWPRVVQSVSIHGNQAIVVVEGNLTARTRDPKGGSHDFGFKATTRDRWVRAGNGWKLQKGDVVKSSMTLDGKAMTPH